MSLEQTGTGRQNAAGTGAQSHGIVPEGAAGGPPVGKVQWRKWAIEQAVASGAPDPLGRAHDILAMVFEDEASVDER